VIQLPKNLKERFGSRCTDSRFECSFYGRDVAYIPPFLVRLLTRPVPDMVFRPLCAEEVSEIIAFAGRRRLAVTPRAGGSTALGSCVPVKAGIVIDLNGLKGVLGFEAGKEKVKVLPGTTWAELDGYLRRRGYCVRSYPSSFHVATIGGWLSGGGCGVGSLRYGPLVNQVSSLEVVLPSGEIRRVTRHSQPCVSWFAAAEGTLGVITGVELKVRTLPEATRHFLLASKEPGGLFEAARDCARGLAHPVYNLHYNSRSLNWALQTGGLAPEPLGRYHTLAVSLEGTPTDLDRAGESIWSMVKGYGLTMLDDSLALEEWENRFRLLRIRRLYPSLLACELLVPTASCQQYLEEVENLGRQAGVRMLTYAHIISRDQALVMTLYYSDEGNPFRYLCDASLTARIYRTGCRLGGGPYTIGFWNTPYLHLQKIHHPDRLQELRQRKLLLDPQGILNPGKVYGPTPLLSPVLFGIGLKAAGFLRVFLHERVRCDGWE